MPNRIVFPTLLCIVLASACRSPYAGLEVAPDVRPERIQKFRPTFSTFIYKTDVDVVGKHLSGLLVFKTMPDNSRRVVFTSETGPTIFDFKFKRGAFRVQYCMKKLNRKAVIRTLRSDFELLLMENPGLPAAQVLRDSTGLYFPFSSGKETNYFITDAAGQALVRMEKAGKRKKKVIIRMAPFQSGMPDSLQIEHQSFTFVIRLTALDRRTPGSSQR